MSVTSEVFHKLMGPCSASALFGSSNHAVTALCNSILSAGLKATAVAPPSRNAQQARSSEIARLSLQPICTNQWLSLSLSPIPARPWHAAEDEKLRPRMRDVII
eukprot:4915964-Amphidinium_carterae.1